MTRDLLARLEAATGPDRDLDWRIAEAMHVPFVWPQSTLWPPFVARSKMDLGIPAYSSSLDAALSLVPEGWDWSIAQGVGELAYASLAPAEMSAETASNGATPALALCIAALRAREAGDA